MVLDFSSLCFNLGAFFFLEFYLQIFSAWRMDMNNLSILSR